jgi:hypothetical protein
MSGSDNKTNVEIKISNKNTERETKKKDNKYISCCVSKKKDKQEGPLTSSKLIWSKIIKLILK